MTLGGIAVSVIDMHKLCCNFFSMSQPDQPAFEQTPQDRPELLFSMSDAQLADLKTQCMSTLKKKALLAGAGNLVPIPGLDVAMDLGLLASLINDVNHRYKLHHKDVEVYGQKIPLNIINLVLQSGTQWVGRQVTQVLLKQTVLQFAKRIGIKQFAKYVPVIGQLTAASISYYLLLKLGQKHIEDCEKAYLRMRTAEQNNFKLETHDQIINVEDLSK